ncbi:Esa1p-associated factor [Parahypoxylon ruwenzoriense]
MAPSRQNQAPPYAKDERVLCFHGDLMYEAKIIEVSVKPGQKPEDAQYRIHYKGWKASWDDWVSQDRIRKFTEDNKQLANQLQAQARMRTQGPKGGKKGTKTNGSEMSSARGSEERAAGASSFGGRGPRRGRDYELESLHNLPGSIMESSASRKREKRVVSVNDHELSPRSPRNRAPEVIPSDSVGRISTQPSSKAPPAAYSAVTMPAPLSGSGSVDTQSYFPSLSTRLSASSAVPPQSTARTNSDSDIRSRQIAFQKKEQRYARAQAAKDYLLQLPDPQLRYVDEDGQILFSGERFGPKEVPDHPKLREAERQGTLTREKELWYRNMPHDIRIPVAGIPSEKPYTPRDVTPGHANPKMVPANPQDTITNAHLQEETFHSRPSIKLIVPDVLKAMLVDDWENITKNNQLVPLPHPHPVTKILEDYAAYETPKRPAGSSHVDILEETLSGLKEYFDKSLGRILLYRFERSQFADIHKKWMSDDPEFQGKTASDTYGAEHLMRLLAQTNMDQQSVNRLREELSKFCTWLAKNATEYFVSQYESPSQDYIQKTKD